MQEIKFRVYDLDEEKMIADGRTLSDKIYLYVDEGDRITGRKGTKIVQYTGLKDKNGKDIYEGDILTDHGEEGLLYIDYSKERASFDFVDKFDQFGITRYAAFQISYEQFEIIGNKYEHTHLLEGEPK